MESCGVLRFSGILFSVVTGTFVPTYFVPRSSLVLSFPGTLVPRNFRSLKLSWWNHMVTYSQISNFTYVNQLLKMSKSENETNIFEHFTLYNYFATNHTCACSAISTSQLFTSSVYRPRTIIALIVLDFSCFNCSWMRLQTLNLTLILFLTLSLKLTVILRERLWHQSHWILVILIAIKCDSKP